MGEPTQIISAAFGLAKNAFETAKWLQRVSKARSDAEHLSEFVLRLRGLAIRIGHYLERNQPEAADPIVEETLRSIKASIRSCEGALNTLDKMGRPLAEDSGRSWGRRIKYVWDSDMRQDQEKILDDNVKLMTLELTILMNIKTDVPRAALPFSQSLCEEAEQRRENLEQRVDKLQIPDDANDQDDLELPSTEDEEQMKLWKFPAHLEGQSGAALFVAVACGSSEKVKQLLIAGCDPDLRDEHDRTLVHRTCQNLDSESLKYLLAAKDRLPEGGLDATDDRGDTALMLLAKQANHEVSLQMAKQLLAAGCSVSAVNRSETPRDALYYAMDAPKDEHRVAFVRMLAGEFDADLLIIQEAFPRAVRLYLGKEGAQSQDDAAVEEGEEDGETQQLDRKQSLLDRVVRRLSHATPNAEAP